MGMFHMVNMVIGVIKSDWVNFCTRRINCSLRRACVFYVSLFLSKSFGYDPRLWLFWRSCSLGEFVCLYNGPPKRKFSSVPSCYIGSSLTPFLLIPHTRQFYFRYAIEDALDIWKDLGWYCWIGFMSWCCWPVFLCWHCCLVLLCWYCWLVSLLVCWFWFGTLWWWDVFPKFLLKMGSII